MQKISIKNLWIKYNILLLQHSFQNWIKKFIVRITILQTDIKWARPEKNMAVVNKLISENRGTELFVLPEMWTTGFLTDPKDMTSGLYACDPLEWMKQTAYKNGCAICGSVSIKTNQDEYRNRLYFVEPDGKYYFYDKRHLFTYGGEDKRYTAGKKRTIVPYKGIRFLIQTCYDLRFPVWMRCIDDYDAIIITANWPQKRQNAWQILLRARAIENQCYVIGCNRIGNDPKCSYIGHSAIIDAKGHTLIQAKTNIEQAITADISIKDLQNFRYKFPALNDKDKFEFISQE